MIGHGELLELDVIVPNLVLISLPMLLQEPLLIN